MAAPLRIGLTGGIASGKSTVARGFADLGAAVIDTDLIAREIVEPGKPALQALVAALGPELLDADGRLDRQGLRERIFRDQATRHRVEAILHPAIRTELAHRSQTVRGPYQILVIPLLVEGGGNGLVDRTLVVDCPESLQLERLVRRDGESAESARRALAAQATREQRLAAADDVIINDREPADLAPQVARLDRRYRTLAENPGNSR